MSYEFWTTAAAVGTFFVIAATAIAALIQLRHARGNNQITAALAINEVTEGDEFQTARRYLHENLDEQLKDFDFRQELARTRRMGRQAQFVGNYYELIGIFVKNGLIDENLACEMWSNEIIMDWNRLAPALAILDRERRHAGWENFEYVYDLCRRWQARYPNGRFPRSRQPVMRVDVWLKEDGAATAPD